MKISYVSGGETPPRDIYAEATPPLFRKSDIFLGKIVIEKKHKKRISTISSF